MIAQAALSLASKGLQRTSFAEVLEASGAPRGSLYHHFPGGKDELILAALDLASDWAMRQLETSHEVSATEAAQRFVELWRGLLVRSDLAAGCAVAAVTVAAESPELAARAAEIFRRWRAHLASALERGGIAEPRATSFAALLIAACEGAVILARAERSLEPFERTVAMLVQMISDAIEP